MPCTFRVVHSHARWEDNLETTASQYTSLELSWLISVRMSRRRNALDSPLFHGVFPYVAHLLYMLHICCYEMIEKDDYLHLHLTNEQLLCMLTLGNYGHTPVRGTATCSRARAGPMSCMYVRAVSDREQEVFGDTFYFICTISAFEVAFS